PGVPGNTAGDSAGTGAISSATIRPVLARNQRDLHSNQGESNGCAAVAASMASRGLGGPRVLNVAHRNFGVAAIEAPPTFEPSFPADATSHWCRRLVTANKCRKYGVVAANRF